MRARNRILQLHQKDATRVTSIEVFRSPAGHVASPAGKTGMLVVALVSALALVLVLRNAMGFALGALVVACACVLQANAYTPIGLLNDLRDAGLAVATYAALGSAILFASWLKRALKGASRS